MAETTGACQRCGAAFTVRFPSRLRVRKYCSRACHYAATRTGIERACESCGVTFSARRETTAYKGGRFCSKACQYAAQRTGRNFDQRAFSAAKYARNRAFVAKINARTVCAHCGAQPIEWHNPEHVELNRQRYRISSMVRKNSLASIQVEMDRCTPLCRRCHMQEDGRLARLGHQVRGPSKAPEPCESCGRLAKPRRRGLCSACYQRQQKANSLSCLETSERQQRMAAARAKVLAAWTQEEVG